jgi:type VI secretion system protein ImpC
MPKSFDFGGVHLTSGEESQGERARPDNPFCVAILGDFSGRANRGVVEAKTIDKRCTVPVDRDNFDEVMSHCGGEIRLPIGSGDSIRIRFSELEDFHPDRMFERLEVFGKLRELRARVQDPATFREAAEELGLRASEAVSHAPRSEDRPPSTAAAAAQLAGGNLLDEMIAQTESKIAGAEPKREPDAVREFAQRVAAKYEVSTPDSQQPRTFAVLDAAVGGLMRAILHNPDFQAMEAAWRATHLLVRELETGSQLKLCLVDVSKEELAEDLSSVEDLRDTGIYRLLVEKSVEIPGADPWAVIVGNYRFSPDSEDVKLLAGMAKLAHRARAPFLAEARTQLLGCASFAFGPNPREWKVGEEQAKRWAELRHLPEANSVGLALPRFLLRLPYGKKSSPLELFDFEEFPEVAGHEDYLWGNPAFGVAMLLAQSFRETGWEMRPGTVAQMERLPIHIYRENGGHESKPCAEALLTEVAVERIVEVGLIPLVSFKDRDSVRVARFQSIAEPPQGIAGRWGSSAL